MADPLPCGGGGLHDPADQTEAAAGQSARLQCLTETLNTKNERAYIHTVPHMSWKYSDRDNTGDKVETSKTVLLLQEEKPKHGAVGFIQQPWTHLSVGTLPQPQPFMDFTGFIWNVGIDPPLSDKMFALLLVSAAVVQVRVLHMSGFTNPCSPCSCTAENLLHTTCIQAAHSGYILTNRV